MGASWDCQKIWFVKASSQLSNDGILSEGSNEILKYFSLSLDLSTNVKTANTSESFWKFEKLIKLKKSTMN